MGNSYPTAFSVPKGTVGPGLSGGPALETWITELLESTSLGERRPSLSGFRPYEIKTGTSVPNVGYNPRPAPPGPLQWGVRFGAMIPGIFGNVARVGLAIAQYQAAGPPVPEFNTINWPGNAWDASTVYISGTYGGRAAANGSSATTWTVTPGVSFSNDIINQAVTVTVGGHTNLRMGFWGPDGQYDSIPGRRTHIMSLRRFSGSFGDALPTLTHTPAQPGTAAKYTYILVGAQVPIPEKVNKKTPHRIVGNGRRLLPRLPRPPDWPAPPGKRTKEKKGAVSYGVAGAIFGGLTEVDDLLNCIHGALPKHLRAKPVRIGDGQVMQGGIGSRPTKARAGGWRAPTISEKAMAVYANINQVDLGAAVKCMVMNQIEDYLIGRIGGLVKGANQTIGRPFGIGIGPAL